MIAYTWDDVDTLVSGMNLKGKKIWGIPRGGAIVAGMARLYGAIVVADPREADVAIDDIIDSGITARSVYETHGLNTVALINKERDRIDSWVHFPWEESSEQDIASSVTRIIEYLGDNPRRNGLLETPQRVVKSWNTLFSGYQYNPKNDLKWFEDDTDEMVICQGISFFSTCEHHMLPFFGTVAIGYIPNGRVIGVSKLARLVIGYSRRLQIQEQLTRQIGEALTPHVLGVGVHVVGQHLCMMSRGVEQQASTMITNYLTGRFRESDAARAEFLTAVQQRS
mgnify:FL=1